MKIECISLYVYLITTSTTIGITNFENPKCSSSPKHITIQILYSVRQLKKNGSHKT